MRHLEMAGGTMTILRSLNRLRLRLGLFRWRNYGRIVTCFKENHLYGQLLSRTARELFGYDTFYTITWSNGKRCKKKFDLQWQAIAHIRRCVRRGER
jgi:hypothetical protein